MYRWCVLLKVLIAMKSELLARRLADALTEYDLHVCHTGKEALTKTETLRPDILLLDLQLSDMTGFALLEQLRCKPRIMFGFTVFADDMVLKKAAELGIQSLFLLPCSVRAVRQQLDALTEKALFAES